MYLVTLLCLTLCDPMDCRPPGSSDRGDSSGKNTGVGCLALLQGIFPTQGSNPGLPHCKQIIYCMSHQGSLKGTQQVVLKEARLLENILIFIAWVFKVWLDLALQVTYSACLILCDSMDCSPPGSPVHRISQARILK